SASSRPVAARGGAAVCSKPSSSLRSGPGRYRPLVRSTASAGSARGPARRLRWRLPADPPAPVLGAEHPGRKAPGPKLEAARDGPRVAARAVVRPGVLLDLPEHGGAPLAPARPVGRPQVDPAGIGQARVRVRLPAFRHDPDLRAAEQPVAVGQ